LKKAGVDDQAGGQLEAIKKKRNEIATDLSQFNEDLLRKQYKLGDPKYLGELESPEKESLWQRFEDLEAKRASVHRKDRKATRLTDQIEVLKQSIEAVRALHGGWVEMVRDFLNQRIQHVYNQIAMANRKLELDRNFRLSIQEKVDGDWVPSPVSGANQAVLAVCFVAAVIELANNLVKATAGSELEEVLALGRYPMIMDNPFSSMGEHFRHSVPAHLATEVPQLVMIMYQPQWHGTVANVVSSRVGKAYVTHWRTSGTKTVEKPVLGVRCPYVTNVESALDWSSIEEVSR
jgi:DNA sulfur modification protein DndD